MLQGHRRFGGQRRGHPRMQGGARPRQQNKIRYMQVDPRMLVRQATADTRETYQPSQSFATLPIDALLKQNILAKGYELPTPIQDQIIPQVLEGKDVIGLAATGTGKTAAFLIPLLNKVVVDSRQKVLIIVPTRELAVQIIDEGRGLARGMRAYFAIAIGGVGIERQVRELARKPAFVVGTPGRIKDLTERGALKLHEYRTIVLDEVDRMLDMGFVHEIRALIARLPSERHSMFFSATMPDKARSVAREFLQNPVVVQVASARPSDNVNQDIVRLEGRSRTDVLYQLLTQPGFDKVLVFGRTKHGMERLARRLAEWGLKATAIHGNKTQSQRQRALLSFRRGEVAVLLATDVAARGLDIEGVTHVINYELPETYEDYIHRIGRTGRAGQVGTALTLIE